MNWKTRFENPYFIFGIIGLFFTATQTDPSTFTTWQALYNGIMHVLGNPFLVGSFIVALAAVIVDPTTAGFKDKNM